MSANKVTDVQDLVLFVKSDIDDYGLDPYEFRIYARIIRRAGRVEAWESIPSMARACRMSESRARAALQLLEAAGLIKSFVRNGNTTLRHVTDKCSWIHPEVLDQLRTTLTRTKNDTPTKSDRGTKNATRCKSDTGDDTTTPTKSDMGVVTQLTPLPLAKVTDEGYPVEVTTQLIKSLPPTPQNAVNSQSEGESLFSSHDEIETTSVSHLTELGQPELFGKEVAKAADKSMHSETKIDRQTPELGLPKQPPTGTIASNSTDIAQSNQPVDKYSECSKRDAEGGSLCGHRQNRNRPQLPKNIKAIACLGKPIIAASSTQSLKNGWREA